MLMPPNLIKDIPFGIAGSQLCGVTNLTVTNICSKEDATGVTQKEHVPLVEQRCPPLGYRTSPHWYCMSLSQTLVLQYQWFCELSSQPSLKVFHAD